VIRFIAYGYSAKTLAPECLLGGQRRFRLLLEPRHELAGRLGVGQMRRLTGPGLRGPAAGSDNCAGAGASLDNRKRSMPSSPLFFIEAGF
jgi:hypothetical protein